MRPGEEIKFSVIVPVYNNTDTVERALDSIFNQKYSNFECILSNDASDVDYSYLKEKYKDLIIYNRKENGGPGVARQSALDNMATGEWVVFVDSDDELHNNALQVFMRYIRRSPEANVISAKYEYCLDAERKHKRVFPSMFGALHGKCFRVGFLRDNNIKFHQDLRYHEDVYTSTAIFFVNVNKYDNKSIVFSDYVIYSQYKTENSAVTSLYDGKPYFVAKYKDHQDLFMNIYNNPSIISNDTDRKTILMVALITTCNFIHWDQSQGYDDEIALAYKFAKSVIELLKKEFGISKVEDFVTEMLNVKMSVYGQIIIGTYDSASDDLQKFRELIIKYI